MRRLAAWLLLPLALFGAWRSFLARASACPPHPMLDGNTSFGSCQPVEWQAWYRWPGTILGLILALAAVAVLVHAAREQRAHRAQPTGRRAR